MFITKQEVCIVKKSLGCFPGSSSRDWHPIKGGAGQEPPVGRQTVLQGEADKSSQGPRSGSRVSIETASFFRSWTKEFFIMLLGMLPNCGRFVGEGINMILSLS